MTSVDGDGDDGGGGGGGGPESDSLSSAGSVTHAITLSDVTPPGQLVEPSRVTPPTGAVTRYITDRTTNGALPYGACPVEPASAPARLTGREHWILLAAGNPQIRCNVCVLQLPAGGDTHIAELMPTGSSRIGFMAWLRTKGTIGAYPVSG